MTDALLRDVAFGVRMLRRTPAVSALVVLCLGLGIGANTAVCSWIEGILLRPYPAVMHQERMLAMMGTVRGGRDLDDLSWPDFLDLREGSRLVEAFVADKIMGVTLSLGDHAERASGSVVSAGYFDALGVRPLLGRGFLPEEEHGRNAHPVTVISYGAWKERYGGDRRIIGRVQRLNGIDHVIVGVAPPEFRGTFVGYRVDYFVPASMAETFAAGAPRLEERDARWIEGYVRLRPGVTLAQAQGELSAIAARLADRYPLTNRGRGLRLMPLWKTPFNAAAEMRATLGLALAAVGLLLAIACANVGNLLAVRALARRREMALRVALGGGRARLVRQLLTEAAILAVLAAGCGLLVARACRDLLAAILPVGKGAVLNLGGALDTRVLLACAVIAALAVVLAALLPALQASRVDPAPLLTAESASVVGPRGRARLHAALVLVQVSLGFALLVGTGLVARSLAAMLRADPGFSTSVLSTSIGLQDAAYDDARARTFQDALIARVRTLPGVESAALVRVSPFTYLPYSTAPLEVDGYQPAPDEQPTVEFDEVSAGYLGTMGIPLRAGRDIVEGDDERSEQVAVINETMAARYFAGREPLGTTFSAKGRRLRVVGIAATTKLETLLEPPTPFFYVPLRQSPAKSVNLMVRTKLPASTLAAALAREVQALDPALVPYAVVPMRETIDSMTSAQRVSAILLAVFGGLALLLAAIGLYGVMAQSVAQQRRELGLRIALGASGRGLMRLVLGRGLALTALGLALGIALAGASTRLLAHLLYGVGPLDPLIFAGALAVMLLVAAGSCWLPARRAMRADPLQSLRF